MIINISRAKDFRKCRTFAKLSWEEGYRPNTEAIPLMTGGAFHKGIEAFFNGKTNSEAAKVAEEEYREKLQGQLILPEEEKLIEQQIELSRRMVEQYAQHYTKEMDYQVLYPEVSFMVPLPGTEHHCWYAHQLLNSDSDYDIMSKPDFEGKFFSASGDAVCRDTKCWQPHYLKGKTDAVIGWRKMLWLLEHKTSAITGDIFYAKYELDDQISGYIYGIWKTLGIRPHGSIVNLIKKPNKSAKDQLAVSFEREPFLRSEEDILSFEHDIIGIANDYEEAMRVQGTKIYKNPESCLKYNRRCYFHGLCKRNGKVEEGEFRQREPDYVDLSYYELLGLEVPSNANTLKMPDTSTDES